MEAILSLGSNLGNRLACLAQAREALASLPQTSLVASSRVYLAEPVDVPADSHAWAFLNAVVVLETALTPPVLLVAAHAIELQLGRARSAIRNAPRTIDIDLIACGDLRLDTPALQLPHPRAHLRRFVCEPLAELRPDLVLPGQRLPIRAILTALPASPSVTLASEQWA